MFSMHVLCMILFPLLIIRGSDDRIQKWYNTSGIGLLNGRCSHVLRGIGMGSIALLLFVAAFQWARCSASGGFASLAPWVRKEHLCLNHLGENVQRQGFEGYSDISLYLFA